MIVKSSSKGEKSWEGKGKYFVIESLSKMAKRPAKGLPFEF
jgi:hypothetical protein